MCSHACRTTEDDKTSSSKKAAKKQQKEQEKAKRKAETAAKLVRILLDNHRALLYIGYRWTLLDNTGHYRILLCIIGYYWAL